MANTVFKYHQQHQHHQHHLHNHQPHAHQQHHGNGSGIATIDGGVTHMSNGSSLLLSGSGGFSSNHNQNNSNQNSIFVLNAETKISPNSCRKFYLDFNDNSVDSSSASLAQSACHGANVTSGAATAASSSVWSSASSTMCSPAAHAIQKLFNCSSGSTSKHQSGAHHSNGGIETKSSTSSLSASSAFKTSKAELLKKKSKFWQYLEGEGGYEGIDSKKAKAKSRKHKSKYWLSKSYANDNQNNHNDLSELLEYSCSLCDNCRCMDCQIGYFDCDNSDDSNSEYSFHLNAYDEDDDIERGMELTTTITAATQTAITSSSSLLTSTTSVPATPELTPVFSSGDGDGVGDGVGDVASRQEGGDDNDDDSVGGNLNSLHTLVCNKMDNKNTIQQLEFENSTRRTGSHGDAKHAGGGGGAGAGGVVDCCHQCYGLEVEQHCLDFHQLYSDYTESSHHKNPHHHHYH